MSISTEYRNLIKEIILKYLPGAGVSILSSHAWFDEREVSDVDVLIRPAEALSRQQKAVIEAELAAYDLPFSVELINEHRCAGAFESRLDLA